LIIAFRRPNTGSGKDFGECLHAVEPFPCINAQGTLGEGIRAFQQQELSPYPQLYASSSAYI